MHKKLDSYKSDTAEEQREIRYVEWDLNSHLRVPRQRIFRCSSAVSD